MTVIVRNNPSFKYTIASTGQPGAGYKLFTYEEGTSTKKTTWTSLAKTAENTNPVILDANGEADVWIDGNYKFVLAPPTDTDPPTSPVKTWDAIRSTDSDIADALANPTTPLNGSFEEDTDADGVPDNWTVTELSGGTIAIDSSSQSHGEVSLKFTSTGAGGGTATTDDYYEVEAGKDVGIRFSLISADADTNNKVDIFWYNSVKTYLSTTSVYNDSATNPTTWTRKYLSATAPATAKFARIVITGVSATSVTHSTTNFDNIELDAEYTGEIPSDLKDITATAAEINTLDGITATTTELNYSGGVTSAIQTQIDSKPTSPIQTADIDASQVTAAKLEASERMTTSNVTGAIAGANTGAVGTYAMLTDTGTGTIAPGGTLPYTSLYYTNAGGITAASQPAAGVWRLMGHLRNTEIAAPDRVSLWLRIS